MRKHTPNILAKAFNEDWRVRKDVAANPATPPETLTFLSKDKDALIRWAVASNPSIPPETMVFLLQDKDTNVRSRLATNPSVTSDIPQTRILRRTP